MKKNYIILAILASVWSVVELQLGTLLHSTNLPFVGLVMMAIGIFFQTAARYVTRMRGSALLAAVVVSFFKLLVVGGIAVSTVIAIFIQSSLLELIYAQKAPSRLRMSMAAGAALCYSLIHPFISMPVLMGLTIVDAYERITKAGSILFGLPHDSGMVIFFGLLVVHFLTGFFAGIISFNAISRMNLSSLYPGFIRDNEL